MYYTSTNKEDLESYNSFVSAQIGLSNPLRWAYIIEHKDGGQFAILKHQVHTSDTLTELASLDGWFETELM